MQAPHPLRLSLAPSPATPRHARRAVAGFLAARAPRRLDDVLLVVSELVTNAVMHAGGGELTVEVDHDLVRVEVSDRSPRPPVVGTPGDHGHRGLPIIDLLAESWGTTVSPEGKVVWCEIDTAEGETP